MGVALGKKSRCEWFPTIRLWDYIMILLEAGFDQLAVKR